EHEHEHHHEHDEHCCCGHDHEHEHEHHHEHDEHCSCGHHHDHDHHHADEVFTSWGAETPRKFSAEEIEKALSELQKEEHFGTVLRAKGFVDAVDGQWIYFDYVPGEASVRRGGAEITGRICVIGSKINEQAIKELFNIG
ncbi:MAG: GTP-binding protein, partial [Oscillospiraceae bacterium]|nr:GTP-binding protein [Oscillospiraceae bacterium]